MTAKKSSKKAAVAANDAPAVSNAYDEVPYESYPYNQTHPDHLFAIAKLFGIDAPDYKKCRVLELGCSIGGNLIPIAFSYPETECVGIDLSKKQIDLGNKHVKDLKLSNLTLKQMSIMDITKSFGQFDYIIVHGILSWVPTEVQDKIFQVCKENLSPNGIAYISYNTLPGWNMVRSVREMMLYHTAKFTNPAEKVKQARLLLNFIKDGIGDKKNPYGDFIESEINLLKGVRDSYLMHDHLEQENHAFYFHEFMAKAAANDLHYLGDTSISTMFTGNMPATVGNVLMTVQSDAVRTEQYMDFVNNRRFRSTLLCHSGTKVNRNLTPQSLKDLYVATSLRVAADAQPDEAKYTAKGGKSLTVKKQNKVLVDAMNLFCAQGAKPIALTELVKQAKKVSGSTASEKQLEDIIGTEVLRILLAGLAEIYPNTANFATTLSDSPRVSSLARYQATYADWVTNLRQEKIALDVFHRVLITYCDGQHTQAQIVQKMIEHINKGDLQMNDSATKKKMDDQKRIAENTKQLVDRGLDMFVQGVLVEA